MKYLICVLAFWSLTANAQPYAHEYVATEVYFDGEEQILFTISTPVKEEHCKPLRAEIALLWLTNQLIRPSSRMQFHVNSDSTDFHRTMSLIHEGVNDQGNIVAYYTARIGYVDLGNLKDSLAVMKADDRTLRRDSIRYSISKFEATMKGIPSCQ